MRADTAIKILRNGRGLTIETNRLFAGDGGNLRRCNFDVHRPALSAWKSLISSRLLFRYYSLH